MRRNTQLIRVLLSLIGFLSSGAFASTEPPGGYDGRSVAMGGTGAAYIHNAAAIYHNPAGLSGVEHFTATAMQQVMSE